jgi:hypothetical protein
MDHNGRPFGRVSLALPLERSEPERRKPTDQRGSRKGYSFKKFAGVQQAI